MKRNILLLLSVSLFAGAFSAAAQENIPWDEIRDASSKYLETCISRKSRDSMCRKLQDRTEQRVRDGGMDEDRAAGEVMMEWAMQNRGGLERMDPRVIPELCFYVATFCDRGYFIPTRIRSALTPMLVNKFLDHLNGEIRRIVAGGAPDRAG